MDEIKAALFLVAFHAALVRAESPLLTPAEHEAVAQSAADAAEKGAAEFGKRFPEAGGLGG